MVSLTCFNRRFTPSWRMVILALLAILFFTRLGFWQLQRAEEKKQMLQEQASQAKQAPLSWDATMALPGQYQPVRVSGQYLDQTLLLDNQHYQHRFGYHVITPFLLNSGQILLIDRGWVAGDIRRQVFPEVTIPEGVLRLTGSAYYPSAKNWLLGQAMEEKTAKMAIVELVDIKLISQFLHKSVYPFIIRLENGGGQDFVGVWPVVAMPPERHYAYAVQWFAIASLVLILFIALNMKKNYENEQT